MSYVGWASIVGSWLLAGIVMTVLAATGHFTIATGVVLLVPLLLLFGGGIRCIFHFWQPYTRQLQVLLLIWLSHAVQLLTPETGFDALWYHLPVAQAVLENQGLVYVPELYQSLNPLFSDLYFTVGFLFAGTAGAKLIGYCFGLLLVASCYFLARVFLNVRYSLWLVCCVSLLQVVAWQAASFYVDIARAVWEVTALWVLLQFPLTKKTSIAIGLLLGAGMATKLFSFVLLPVFIGLILITEQRSRTQKVVASILMAIAAVFVALPYYFYSYQHTGNPLFAISLHLTQLAHIGGEASHLKYVWQRVVRLPFLPFALAVSRDYVGPLSLIGVGIASWFVLMRRRVSRELSVLAYFAVSQLLIWWLVPPLSTRYAVSGFIVLTLLGVYGLSRTERLFSTTMHKKYWYVTEWLVPTILWVTVVVLLIPRILVNYRSLQFILGKQTQSQYLTQFLDGNSDSVLYSWYGQDLAAKK